jgi:hypothetical protein
MALAQLATRAEMASSSNEACRVYLRSYNKLQRRIKQTKANRLPEHTRFSSARSINKIGVSQQDERFFAKSF